MLRVFKHYLSLQIILLAAVDLLVLCGSMYAGSLMGIDAVGPQAGVPASGTIWPKAMSYAAIMFLIMCAMGLYERDFVEVGREYYGRFTLAFGLGLISQLLLSYMAPGLFTSAGIVALTVLFSIFGTLAVRGVLVRAINQNVLRKRSILVIGCDENALQFETLLDKYQLRWKFFVVGFLPVNSGRLAVEPEKLMHNGASVLAVATQHQVQEIVLAVRDRRAAHLPMQQLLDCKLAGINVVDLPTFFERETGHVQLDAVNTSWMLFSDGFCHTSVRCWVKRMFDIVISLMLLTLTFPLLILTALLILMESEGPVLYRQARVGELGRTFDVMKFRSMRADAERDGVPQWAQKADARVTRVGRVIRMLRIDELPQLFNVLRGDMSFVGPRPERPYFVGELNKQIPYYSSRHTVKPGITGWAQIRYPYGASVADAREKLQYDLYYAKNHSLFLDIIILLMTAEVVLLGKGAR
ncbi:MAG: TIGR03013 family PEP-CTERM/XrtA system glycosyltransferase [Gammaproteobacteria bacterium]|nr:TIGR03013 family PEP-CTERM/XrtA system glycosyltransferase [Gammaproteobacteria bacterium]